MDISHNMCLFGAVPEACRALPDVVTKPNGGSPTMYGEAGLFVELALAGVFQGFPGFEGASGKEPEAIRVVWSLEYGPEHEHGVVFVEENDSCGGPGNGVVFGESRRFWG